MGKWVCPTWFSSLECLLSRLSNYACIGVFSFRFKTLEWWVNFFLFFYVSNLCCWIFITSSYQKPCQNCELCLRGRQQWWRYCWWFWGCKPREYHGRRDGKEFDQDIDLDEFDYGMNKMSITPKNTSGLKFCGWNNACIQQVDENAIFLIFSTWLTEFGSGQSFDIYSLSSFPTSCKFIMSDYKSWNCTLYVHWSSISRKEEKSPKNASSLNYPKTKESMLI